MGEKTHARIHVLALRNIFSDPKNLDGFSIKVQQRVSLGAQPAIIAVAPCHTVFDIQIARAVQALLQRMIEFWAIFQMEACQQLVIRDVTLISAYAEQS